MTICYRLVAKIMFKSEILETVLLRKEKLSMETCVKLELHLTETKWEFVGKLSRSHRFVDRLED